MENNIINLPRTDAAPAPMEQETMEPQKIVDRKFLQNLMKALQEYKAGRMLTERRIIAAEQWWKLRNQQQEADHVTMTGYTSASGWLHNVIANKHADAIENYPEPNVLPREEGDKPEAHVLSQIIPVILEQNEFEETYSTECSQKIKFGTGIYKVVWDSRKHNGLGDVGIVVCNPLNIYWEPGIDDIQRSRYIFHTELVDKDIIKEQYPELEGKLAGTGFLSSRFLYDDKVRTDNKATVIECYYHKWDGGSNKLHYVKWVGENVLYASEDDPEYSQRGIYDHGKFPYVFDPLFKIEGSPCGYGMVDLCRSAQTEIDLMNTAFVKNAIAGATPRFFKRQDAGVNSDEFLDLSNTLVEVNGNMGEDSLRKIDHNYLDGNYVNFLSMKVDELRQTSGNTEMAAGSTSGGVTAASAIAALQEASGKGSRDMSRGSYRAYAKVIDLVIELIRQFYDMPRQFRIVGQYGGDEFIQYSNQNIKPQGQGNDFGMDMGFRLPVFDVRVVPQKRNAYTRISQNELAIQLYNLGVFSPQNTDMSMMLVDMMDFDGKEELQQKLARNATIYQKLIQYQQMALALAQKYEPSMVQGLSADIMGGMAPQGAEQEQAAAADDGMGGAKAKESSQVQRARQQAAMAGSVEGGSGK